MRKKKNIGDYKKSHTMQSPSSPLLIHNCTNDELVCRYMQQGKMGRGEVRIGPRGQKLIQDAYMGMKIYASSTYDPSSAIPFHLNQIVDEIHFTETGGGYGKGAPVGPPAAAHDEAFESSRQRVRKLNDDIARKSEAAAAAAADKQLASDGSDDTHGTSLARAHSSDLTKQGGGGGGLTGENVGGEGGDDGRVWVPGMGWMNAADIPPHVLKQLAARRAMERQREIQSQTSEAPPYPDYNAQGRAAALEGITLPPIRLHGGDSTRRRGSFLGGLTRPEQYISNKFHQYMQWSPAKCDQWARPTFFVLVAIAVYGAFAMYRRHRRAQQQVGGGGGGVSRRYR